MYKILVFLLGSLLVASLPNPGSASAPVINFSFYAPAQKDSPVHIVGFEHTKDEIQFVLLNASDKPVISIRIDRIEIAPPGCATEPTKGSLTTSGGHYKLFIPPHGKATLSGVQGRYYAKHAIGGAHSLGAAYMQTQFGVADVFFADGTTWPAHVESRTQPHPFDPELVEAEGGRCADVTTIANALDSVEEVIFDHESPTASDQADYKNLPPHLRFSCSLEGSKAICRLPLEMHQSTKKPEPETSKQK